VRIAILSWRSALGTTARGRLLMGQETLAAEFVRENR
jgi:hypothetical protein